VQENDCLSAPPVEWGTFVATPWRSAETGCVDAGSSTIKLTTTVVSSRRNL